MPSLDNFLCVGSVCWKCGARKFLIGHPERKSNNIQQKAFQHGANGAHGASPNAHYETLLIAGPNQTPDYPRKSDVCKL